MESRSDTCRVAMNNFSALHSQPVAMTLLRSRWPLGLARYCCCRVPLCRNPTSPPSRSARRCPRSRGTIASSVATPLERHFGQSPAHQRLASYLGSTSIALQFDLTGYRRCGRDARPPSTRPQLPAANLQNTPHGSKPPRLFPYHDLARPRPPRYRACTTRSTTFAESFAVAVSW